MTEYYMRDMKTYYVRLIETLIADGMYVEVRDQLTHELTNITLIFENVMQDMLPLDINRGVNTKFAAVETLQIISGTCNPGLLAKANPAYDKVLVSAGTDAITHAAYGPRLEDQYDRVMMDLLRNPTTRQAVLSIWRRDDLWWPHDKPCTVVLQFLIRGNKLELHTTMRSNDVWLGLAYDAFAFTQIQWSMLLAINSMIVNHDISPMKQPLQIGRYVHHTTSLHLYERDLRRAANLLNSPAPYNGVRTPLPMGVRSESGADPLEVANDLLNGNASMEDIALNPWYAEQLERVDIKQKVTVE